MKVSSDGQVTIPQHILEKLDLRTGQEVEFLEEGAKVYLVKRSPRERKTDFSHLRGITAGGLSTDEIMALTRGED